MCITCSQSVFSLLVLAFLSLFILSVYERRYKDNSFCCFDSVIEFWLWWWMSIKYIQYWNLMWAAQLPFRMSVNWDVQTADLTNFDEWYFCLLVNYLIIHFVKLKIEHSLIFVRHVATFILLFKEVLLNFCPLFLKNFSSCAC